jgi:2-oxoisovalerate dehydrogenase E1 component alpha subunit
MADSVGHDCGLRIPPVPARPADAPDFSYLRLSEAGRVARPDPSCAFDDTLPLARELIRVLDEDGRAVGPWESAIPVDELVRGLRAMLLTRAFDDRMQKAHRAGRISFYMRSYGEEAVSVAQALALEPTDMLFPHYRNQGLHFARGRRPMDLMCQVLSNSRDMCKGRQLPVFYHWKQGNIFSVSGNLGTQCAQAVGWAMAAKMRRQPGLAACWVGEGTTAESDFPTALLYAATYRVPFVMNVVNNQWAISTFQSFAGGESATFAQRGWGYGLPGLRVDGNDFLAVHAATRWAAERARAGHGATVIELVTYRAGPHSTSDDPARYRPKNEPSAWPLGDPIERLRQHLVARGCWDDGRHAALVDELERLVADDWREALTYGSLTDGPRLLPATLFDDVFKELPPHLLKQRRQLEAELNRG